MKLRILLSAPHPAWSLFLDQEKVDYQVLVPGDSHPGREAAPVLILTETSPQTARLAAIHLQSGGSVIADSATSSVLPGTGFESQIFKIQNNVALSAENWKSLEKKFTFQDSEVTEIVAAEKKSLTRAAIQNALKNAFWFQGLPYAHLWYYPAPYTNVFSFRFDLDEYDAGDHNVFCRLLEKYRGAVSCFVCTKTFESLEEPLARVCQTGVEVGSHGYVHHVYREETQNRVNFECAETILKKHGQEIEGLTAPHGTWHPTLQKILSEKNYLYSSEFSLDYDNFPFFPMLNGRLSTVLQIPTHPICEGVFMERYPYQEKRLKDYFNAVIENKMSREEPILFFGHPDKRIGRHPEIVENIFKTIEAYPSIWKTEFRQFAHWWKKRHALSWSVDFDQGALKFSSQDPDISNVRVELVFKDGKRELHSLDGRLPVSNITLQPQNYSEVVRESPVMYGTFKKIKKALKRGLDWEIKTPVSILKVTGIRTLTKIVLRKLTGKL